MYLLLSPAKNLNEKSSIPLDLASQYSLPALLQHSAELAKTLKTLDVLDIQELMSVSAKIAELNVARNQAWHKDYQDDEHAKPAAYLFDGDAYKGLDAYELSVNEINYLNAHLGILSGLYGLLKPLDLMLPYRLEMGIKLATANHTDLYSYWGDTITELINSRMQALGSGTLVNLASNEYFGAIKTDKLNARLITPRFEDQKDDVYKVISFYAKRARGLMARFCAVNNISHAEELKGFDMEGYYYCDTLSDDTTWVFRREMLSR
ncbi:MAG: peroxide stress protein YaaA [Moraxella sp.]|nr:peroxide stress protein YaaA [Moraxella sp.]